MRFTTITNSLAFTTAFSLSSKRPLNFRHHKSVLNLSSGSSNYNENNAISFEMNEQERTLTLTHIAGLQDEKLSEYKTLLLDMWGVMHDGEKPYDGVLDAVKQLKKEGKKIIILSNSSKRKDNSLKTLRRLGFDPEADIDEVITSGEISFLMLKGDTSLKCSTWDVIDSLRKSEKTNAFVLGSGDNDEEYCTQAGWSLSPLDKADIIIARGTFTVHCGNGDVIHIDNDKSSYEDALEESLRNAAERKLPMLVTNPDKVRPDAALSPMPGSIGDAYEKLLREKGGTPLNLIRRIGKPYPEVYELALSKLDPNDKLSSVVMVGDALETDVTGGSNAGVATLWVTMDGIHSASIRHDAQNGSQYEEDVKSVLKRFHQMKSDCDEENKVIPTFVTKHFRW